jgi:DNA-binding transcriptional LysR family regulator
MAYDSCQYVMKWPPMDRLAALELFVRVVGSFSAAARERGLSQPAASKQVAALEQSLGARLLHRTTRKVTPTDEGLAYYERAREAVQALREAGAAVRTRDAGLGGTLHVATSVGFGRVSIAPRVAEFLALHPRLSVELHMACRRAARRWVDRTPPRHHRARGGRRTGVHRAPR